MLKRSMALRYLKAGKNWYQEPTYLVPKAAGKGKWEGWDKNGAETGLEVTEGTLICSVKFAL